MRIAGRGLIDRETPVSFTFDGRRYDGFAGDTVASAMLANGQRAATYGPQPTEPADSVALHSSSVSVTGSTQSAGQTNVDIRQPTLALKACIALQGVFPSRS